MYNVVRRSYTAIFIVCKLNAQFQRFSIVENGAFQFQLGLIACMLRKPAGFCNRQQISTSHIFLRSYVCAKVKVL